MLLTALTDSEFLRHAQAEHEPLIASHLDQFLAPPRDWDGKPINVLTEALDAEEMTHDLLAQALALQNVCLEFDIDTPDALRKVLDRDAKVPQILADITQPINTLAEMANAQ